MRTDNILKSVLDREMNFIDIALQKKIFEVNKI